MTHSYVWHDSFIRVTWLIHTCDMTHSYVCETIHSCECHDSFMCVTWLIPICDMTHLYVWHDSSICERNDSFLWVPWLIHVCDMTHSHVWHGSFICVTSRIHMCAKWLIFVGAMTHSCVWHDSFTSLWAGLTDVPRGDDKRLRANSAHEPDERHSLSPPSAHLRFLKRVVHSRQQAYILEKRLTNLKRDLHIWKET